MLRITPEIVLTEVHERFVPSARSHSRTDARHATGVELRLDIHKATLPDEVKNRLLARGRQVTANGALVVVCRARQSQSDNRRAARERLIAPIQSAATPTKPRMPMAPPRRDRPPRSTGRSHTAQHRAVVGKLL
jgi:protein subunit release factor B